jgi:polysaccharide export outer membrane protein
VKTPGAYPYGEGLSVQKAIAMAGGFTEKSDKAAVKVTRRNDKTGEILLLEADAVVMPDDLIVVAQLQKFYVNGEVKRPGDYTYETGMTVHKAIAMAGGFTDKAAMKRAMVLRIINGKESTVELPLDGPVLPEDIIVVRQRFF